MKKIIVSGSKISQFWQGVDWNQVNIYLEDLEQSSQFKKIFDQTKKHLVFSQIEWENNLENTTKIINKLTGLDLDKTFQVYIAHLSMQIGQYFPENTIIWGHQEDFPNYTTIYLWHEILHSYLNNSKDEHALIQLIADNELRIYLNGGKYPPFSGHESLFPLMENLLPRWKNFVQSDNKSTNSLIHLLD